MLSEYAPAFFSLSRTRKEPSEHCGPFRMSSATWREIRPAIHDCAACSWIYADADAVTRGGMGGDRAAAFGGGRGMRP